jgi:hypothetical protein
MGPWHGVQCALPHLIPTHGSEGSAQSQIGLPQCYLLDQDTSFDDDDDDDDGDNNNNNNNNNNIYYKYTPFPLVARSKA